MPDVVPPPKRVNERPSQARSKTGLKASIALCTSAAQPPAEDDDPFAWRKMRLFLTPGGKLPQGVGRLAVFHGRGQAQQNGPLAPVEARQLFANALNPLEGVAGAQQGAAGGGRPPRRSKPSAAADASPGGSQRRINCANGLQGLVGLLDEQMQQGPAGPGPGKIHAGFDLLAAAVDRIADHRRRQARHGIVGHVGDFEFEVAQQRHRRGGVHGDRLMKQLAGLGFVVADPALRQRAQASPRLFADGAGRFQRSAAFEILLGCADGPSAFRPGPGRGRARRLDAAWPA